MLPHFTRDSLGDQQVAGNASPNMGERHMCSPHHADNPGSRMVVTMRAVVKYAQTCGGLTRGTW